MSATPMRLRVRDVLGVASAEVALSGLTLIAGLNGSGKSSLLNAAAAAALRVWTLRGARTKAMAGTVVRDGAESGTASLDWGTGAIRVTWPSGDIEAAGDASTRQMGSAVALGAIRWMDVDPKVRQGDLAERLNMAPTAEDILNWLTEKGVANATALAAAIADKVHINGWDAVHKTAQEHGVKLKGRWEQATGGVRWGDSKAKSWAPSGLLHGEAYTMEAAEADVATAREALDKIMTAGAVKQADLEAAVSLAGHAPEWREKVTRLAAEGEELRAALKRLEEQLEAMPAPPSTNAPPTHDCPHCGEPVVIRGNGLAKPGEREPALTDEQKMARAGLMRAIADTKGKIAEHGAAAQRAEVAAMQAEQAAARVEKMKAAPKADTEAIAKAQTALARVEARREAVQQYLTATGIYQQWLTQQPITEALSPAGVRGAVLAAKIGAFNDELAGLCRIAKWAPVAVTPEGDLTFGGRSYPLMSESEKWRADLTMQVALAMREGAALLLVDRLDVLVPASRSGAIALLKQAGIPALIAMSQPSAETVPDLAKMGLGRSAWIERGTLQLL